MRNVVLVVAVRLGEQQDMAVITEIATLVESDEQDVNSTCESSSEPYWRRGGLCFMTGKL